jgi:catechol 2,3-dioxygenase-like lactoylglutathione lyase family enzyme
MKPFNDLLLEASTMLVVNDLAVSIEFHRDRLGFELLDRQEHIATLRLGSLDLYLFTYSPPTPDKPNFTLENLNQPGRTPVIIDLLVSDCQAAYDRLIANGINFLTPPHTPPWGGRRCFAPDPDGYLIEIEERLASPFRNKSHR